MKEDPKPLLKRCICCHNKVYVMNSGLIYCYVKDKVVSMIDPACDDFDPMSPGDVPRHSPITDHPNARKKSKKKFGSM